VRGGMAKWRGTRGVVDFYKECEPLHGELGVCKGEKESGDTRLARRGGATTSPGRNTCFGAKLLSVELGSEWEQRGRVGLPGARVNVCGNGVD
jgi:hypothetical protein